MNTIYIYIYPCCGSDGRDLHCDCGADERPITDETATWEVHGETKDGHDVVLGRASRELVRASLAEASGTGWVPAYQMVGVWHPGREDDGDRRVYVILS